MFVSDVNIQQKSTGLPGIAALESIVGARLTARPQRRNELDRPFQSLE